MKKSKYAEQHKNKKFELNKKREEARRNRNFIKYLSLSTLSGMQLIDINRC